MKTNRRKFLSLLGVSTAAGPLAVKAAADNEIASLAGVYSSGLRAGYAGVSGSGGIAQAQGHQNHINPVVNPVISASKYVKIFGLPKFAEVNLRENSKYIHALDPDIACKKSWSMSVKIQTQRERNYQSSVDDMLNQGWKEEGKTIFQKMTGFYWPW